MPIDFDNDEDFSDTVDGIFAADQGCASSGIHDTVLKQRLKDYFTEQKKNNGEKFMRRLSLHAVEHIDVENGYTLEDFRAFLDWLENEMSYRV